MSDCFVSLHRAEGFGLGLAEAMLLGKPVIATRYSGNLDFMGPENSLLVDYERVEIKEDRPIYPRGEFWAEPSVQHAAAYMREVFEHPEEARARAERAQAGIERLLCLEAAGKRMRERLEHIAGR
jgi:glycosyltransferase involved in cell wall biosynthesis